MDQDQNEQSKRAALFARTAAGARKLAARLESDPTTMAWVLARYRDVEDMDETLIALSLGIDPDRLPHLALCSRPRDELFRTDVETIAAHVGMDPRPLAEVVRRVDALTGFGQQSIGRSGGVLAAARDRAAEDPAPYNASPLPDEVASDATPDAPAPPTKEDPR